MRPTFTSSKWNTHRNIRFMECLVAFETTCDARLTIANVKRPLLGADFFRCHNLLVDLYGQRLIEADTCLSCPCTISRVAKTCADRTRQQQVPQGPSGIPCLPPFNFFFNSFTFAPYATGPLPSLSSGS
ncbi:transposon Ty3-G Gag-Pol polyprotein [Elysia marginata]|uniref:Transposon Ty3-G Gag-Pol polyprotein n=1 Tax=Elysia marginata TaxID=1093978 RepID=A0AAV4ET11_9GAST|nr:transposon Ty3-G Gag-Pol polyprotein [Elysia marginata]